MRRKAITLVLLLGLAGPASAWEFTPGLPCLLTHESGDVVVELTFDPTLPRYTISVTTSDPWPRAPRFGMQFLGPRGLSIGTTRHQFSDGGRTLSVADSGFGNVLNGLQFNERAVATNGERSVSFSLEGAAPEVAAFRECSIAPAA
ncbi:MAG: hypothetical protein AAF943_16565 [Pseudomonadota bacterium]